MTIFLDRIDSAPLNSEQFSFEFNSWVSILIDSLNENIADIQDAFNLLQAQSYTAAEIVAMNAAQELVNGVILYDTTNNVYVGMQNNSLVQFSTVAWP